MDEFDRIAQLRALFATSQPGLLLGIGDDAAVLAFEPAAAGRNLVLSVDAAVSGVHFRAEFAGYEVVGARAFEAALSDLAAMGAQPMAALSALVLPIELGDAEFLALNRGIARAAERHACPIAGGNLARGTELSITTTVVGSVEGLGLRRGGARPGDAVYVTGVLGAAAFGLHLLGAGRPEIAPACVERWRAPRARIAEGRALAGVATAAVDVSDGALADLGHLCAASGVGAEIDPASLPELPGFSASVRALALDPVALALTGGEDYELIYTLPPGCADPAGGTPIGRITDPGSGVRVRDAQGRTVELSGRGYRHFAG